MAEEQTLFSLALMEQLANQLRQTLAEQSRAGRHEFMKLNAAEDPAWGLLSFLLLLPQPTAWPFGWTSRIRR